MGSENELTIKKNKESGLDFLVNLFEFRRPHKSETLPRNHKKLENSEENVSKDRLFTRNENRRSYKKNKYKKETPQKNGNEKFAIDNNETSVKRIAKQFESQDNEKHKTEITKSAPSTHNETEDVNKVIEKVLDNRKAQLALLKELHENVPVNKRVYEKNAKGKKERKIQSFVEAENDEETEEYRQSLISQMDMELAQMKIDGFLDDEENISRQNSYDEVFEENSTFLEQMHRNQINPKLLASLSSCEINSNEDVYNKQISTEEERSEEQIPNELLERFQDEFSESLSDDLENGFNIVEAYNDDGRELIEVKVIIDRRSIKLDAKQAIDEAIKDSDMVFYQNEDESFNLIHDVELNSKCELEELESKHIVEQLPTTSKEKHLYDNLGSSNKGSYYTYPPSNRSTMYSTTSQESSLVDDDDEGIEVCRNKNGEQVYQSVRRETFCDEKGIVRIERIKNVPFISENVTAPVSRSNSTTPSKRLEFIMDEIKSTEKKYVEDLTKVIKVFKPYIESKTSVEQKDYQGYLFGNIEKIYRRQKTFLTEIQKCQNIDEIVKCFINNETLFEFYPTYFKNKPKADFLIKDFYPIIREMQDDLEERLDFSAYLLTPVQRLGKYILFLENIISQLEKLELPTKNTQKALDIVKNEMLKGNDSVAIESIVNSIISKTDYGSFKMREKFNIVKPRKVEGAMVFLFNNVIVFTTADPRNIETFFYYDSIKMNDLRIATFDDFTIHLTDFTKSKKKHSTTKYTYVLESKSEKVWKNWKETIEKILWDQLNEVKVNSINTVLQNKRRYKVNRNRIKSTGSSVFYCE